MRRLSKREVVLLLLWVLACAILTYWQLGEYVRMFFADYAARYFPGVFA